MLCRLECCNPLPVILILLFAELLLLLLLLLPPAMLLAIEFIAPLKNGVSKSICIPLPLELVSLDAAEVGLRRLKAEKEDANGRGGGDITSTYLGEVNGRLLRHSSGKRYSLPRLWFVAQIQT
jgi:hypothetical protein